MVLRDFLLMGAPKAGTTALHVALARHPQLCLSNVKEPKYFLGDGPPRTGRGPGDAKTHSEYVWRREDYEALWDDRLPGQLCGESTTLCTFLGVETGVLDEMPSENVTAHVGEGVVNNALFKLVQERDDGGRIAPVQVRRAVGSVAVKLLQREQRIRPALSFEERCLLLPHYTDDLNTLERITGRSFAHWRDPENGITRRPLDINGRFGTASSSIDRPFEDTQ